MIYYIEDILGDGLTDLERTYYEYHGWHDEGIDVADSILPYGFSEVNVA